MIEGILKKATSWKYNIGSGHVEVFANDKIISTIRRPEDLFRYSKYDNVVLMSLPLQVDPDHENEGKPFWHVAEKRAYGRI
ncbi:MAG: hypothetical protein Q8755_02850 [Candidatus Phytoplasma australasiaticum]|nr:hypothetical protein [Candidatus Phytoplasma australasiaticum]